MPTDATPPDAAKLIEEGRKIVAAMTKGEWRLQRRWSNECEIIPRITCEPDTDRGCGWIADLIGAPYLGHESTIPNATGIVWLRNNATAMFDQLESATREAERMRAEHKAAQDVVESLAERVQKQSDLLSRKSEASNTEARTAAAEAKVAELERSCAEFQVLGDFNADLIDTMTQERDELRSQLVAANARVAVLESRINEAINHLPIDRDLTNIEAEIALSLADSAPISEERIKEMVAQVLSRPATTGGGGADDKTAPAAEGK